jgi:glycogen operon protein
MSAVDAPRSPAFRVSAGQAEPLGVTALELGVNVAVISTSAESVDFCVFDERGEAEVARLPLERVSDTTFAAFIEGVSAGTRYGLRANGRYAPQEGDWFDPAKLLIDPYAAALDRPFVFDDRLAAARDAQIDTAPLMPKAIVTPGEAVAARLPASRSPGFVYEIGVKAFTKTHPQVPDKQRGTVAALAAPAVIDHLVKLGVDTVELMPIAAWIDERHLVKLGLGNAWGYNPVAFMAPDPRLAPGGLAEVRATVAALHGAGIRVILDVVYNHSGDGDEFGPTLSLRGLDDDLYYRHRNGAELVNDTGTGNTIACDRPPVTRLIIDAMRHWVETTGVDGFRLDLAATLGRNEEGFDATTGLLAAAEADSLLAGRVMIAEPWDIGPGGYQLGHFPKRWSEWNDRFRDDVRQFWRGDAGTLGSLATRLAGSADIFGGRAPSASVNLIAAHDGFALADIVAYAEKHNEANGEDNRDGSGANFSWNNGVEGETADGAIRAARRRDVRAMLATLFASRGTPMLTAGDEMGRTQRGNNNAYAQDNSMTWLDWAGADEGLAAFVGRLVALRRDHPSLRDDSFLTGAAADQLGIPDVSWMKPDGQRMEAGDWAEARVLGAAFYVPPAGSAAGDRTVVWINGSGQPIEVLLPEPRADFVWRRAIDTAHEDDAPADLRALAPRSVVIFVEAPERARDPQR